MARGKRNKPEIDICRVSTFRLRELTVPQLNRAQARIGKLFEIPKRQQGERKPRWLLSSFMAALVNERDDKELSPRSAEAYRRTYGEEPKPQAEITQMWHREANRKERLIWEMQQKRGCRIKPEELVARDAVRQGNIDQETIDRIRGRRRAKIR